MTLPLVPTDELVAAAWIATIPGFTTAMTGPVLPPDVLDDGTAAPWIRTGFVTVEVAGGNPDALLPVQRPVMGVTCWATQPGSNRPPWMLAHALASAITRATRDRTTMNRPLSGISVNGVAYPTAFVQGATILTAFRRVFDDAADYARVTADLWLSWVTPADLITP